MARPSLAFGIGVTTFQCAKEAGLQTSRKSAKLELRLVVEFPEMFPAYDDEHRFALLKRFPYSVVYQNLPDKIQVIALAHSSRQPGYWQGRA